jgi:hypothetical protein
MTDNAAYQVLRDRTQYEKNPTPSPSPQARRRAKIGVLLIMGKPDMILRIEDYGTNALTRVHQIERCVNFL